MQMSIAVTHPFMSPSRSAKSPKPSRRSSKGEEQLSAHDARDLISPEVRAILDEFQLGYVISHLLRRAHFRAEAIFAAEFDVESITPRQKATLVTLYQNPGLNQNALADRLFMDRNTVAEMVRRLVAVGLVQRVPAQSDQRAYELFLAPEGARMLDAVMPRDLEVEHRIAATIPPEYRPLFLKCLRLLIDPNTGETT